MSDYTSNVAESLVPALAAQLIGGSQLDFHALTGLSDSERQVLETLSQADTADRARVLEQLHTQDRVTDDQYSKIIELAAGADKPEDEKAGTALGVHCTDLGNSKRLIAQQGQNVRYCYPTKEHLIYTGMRWEVDNLGLVERIAKGVIPTIYLEAAQADEGPVRKMLAKWAMRSENRTRIQAMIDLARSELAILLKDLDIDPWALNVLNGTLDLKTGELRPHRRSDFITKLAPVWYDPTARHPLWDRFLDWITWGKKDLRQYLQRAAGMSTTGISFEGFFLLIGPGGTGKTTLIEALKSTMGNYAITADLGTFTKGHSVDKPRADVARLRGARFVFASEAADNAQLDEVVIKQLCGGDTIAARHLFKDTIEFKPTGKEWLASNFPPKVRDDDDSIWRRIIRLPMTHQLSAQERDPKVKEILTNPAEAGPAILAWLVGGCLMWQREGLGTCEEVEQATQQYRQEMDPLGPFIQECCTLGPGCWVSAKALREAYQDWTGENGRQKSIGDREWGERLRALGCSAKLHRIADKVERGWQGIGLLGEPVQGELPNEM